MSKYNETITEAYVKMVADRQEQKEAIVEEVIGESVKPKVYHYNEDLAEAYVQMKKVQSEKIEESKCKEETKTEEIDNPTICEKCGK